MGKGSSRRLSGNQVRGRVSTTWDDSFANDLEKQLGDNLERAAIFVTEKVKERLNHSEPYKKSTNEAIITRKGGKTVDKQKREADNKGVYYYGLDPAQPGDAPKKITGSLQRSIAYEMSAKRDEAFVGSNLEYAFYHEVGGPKMPARPFLVPTLLENEDTIAKIIATGTK